jgi:hypothetical protein
VSQRRRCAVAAKSLIEPKKIWEIKMRRKIAISVSSIAIVLLLANPEFAVAKGKKLTLDQAWAVCKAELDRTIPKADHSARYSAGGACLLRHGYRI